jgi:hypothetical protein
VTANATRRSVRSLMRKTERGKSLNILTFPTHERYEENLCKTGHNFYSLKYGKEWDSTYAAVPPNYHIVDAIPESVDFDLVLSHTSCNRLELAHNLLSETIGSPTNKMSVPLLRHCHVLPDARFDTEQEINNFRFIPVDCNSFISSFSRGAWGYGEDDARVVEHGVDTEFWNPSSEDRTPLILSVVNEWPARDWCCGFNLWQKTTQGLPVSVWGKCTGASEGFSSAARDREHLRQIYRTSRIFYNTSLHSPVPTVLLEAMACGCAVVSTATCMIPEIIEHGKNGLISNDPNELRAFLEMLQKDENLANKLGQEARKTICEKYNLQSFMDNWNNLFYDTIENYTDVMEVSNENISQPI